VREYEFIYIIQPDAMPEREQEIHDRVDGVISQAAGTHLLRDDWGKRKLAYEIRKFQKGHYFQVNLLGNGSFVPELERMLRLDPDVLRFLTVLVDPEVKDIDARITKAKEDAAEQERRREERERMEAERAARDLELARAAEAEAKAKAEAEAAKRLSSESELGEGDGEPELAVSGDEAPAAADEPESAVSEDEAPAAADEPESADEPAEKPE